MSTSVNATSRATIMTSINSVAGATAYLFVYSGSAPGKTTSPTGTSAVSGGIALASTAFTQGTDGTDANTKLTLAGVPITATSTASVTPGWYRITNNATDDGTHTVLQGSAGVSSGDLSFSSTISSGGTVTISALTYTEGNP